MLNILVTGFPRSGLTSAAALIDSLPDAVCLNHPIWQVRAADTIQDAQGYSRFIIDDFALRRQQLRAGEAVADLRAAGGAPLMDSLHDPRQPFDEQGGKAFVAYTRQGLTDHFTLAMKQHALYTALLPELVATGQFVVIAVIRRPLDVITSWLAQSDKRAFAQGKLAEPFARFWPEAAALAHLDIPLIERMAQLYDAFCERYYLYRERINIIKYETFIDKPQTISTLLGTKAMPSAIDLIETPQRIHHADTVQAIHNALFKHGAYAKLFYNN